MKSLDETIKFRISAEEKRELELIALTKGQTMSQLMRELCVAIIRKGDASNGE